MTSLAHAPRLTRHAAEQIARDIYGIDATSATLPSERDQNFRLTAANGAGFVLKVANAAEDRGMLEAENATMRQLAGTGLVPRPIVTRGGEEISRHGPRILDGAQAICMALDEARKAR